MASKVCDFDLFIYDIFRNIFGVIAKSQFEKKCTTEQGEYLEKCIILVNFLYSLDTGRIQFTSCIQGVSYNQ